MHWLRALPAECPMDIEVIHENMRNLECVETCALEDTVVLKLSWGAQSKFSFPWVDLSRDFLFNNGAYVNNSCYAVMNNGLSFPLILTFSQGEKGLSPLSLWERAEGEGSPKVYKKHFLRDMS